jgi:hypothetical protein
LELTTVVLLINLSAYNGEPPGDGKARKIAGGPLYDLARIKALTKLPDAVNLWTAKARRDVANLAMEPADVGGMIRQLTERTIVIRSGATMAKATAPHAMLTRSNATSTSNTQASRFAWSIS